MSACADIALGRVLLLPVLVLLGLLAAGPATAVEPDEVLSDKNLEARARVLSQKLRCVVCQNQTIDDSDAPLARDLRVLLRERLTAGDTDGQAVGYIIARYGNFVLLRPPVQLNTLSLWLGPAAILLIALAGFGVVLRRNSSRGTKTPRRLTKAQRKRLDQLL